MKCPSCTTPMEIEDRFCAQCGAMRPILQPSFARAEGEFTHLRAQFQAGTLDREHFITAVKQLTIQDQDGHFWCLGVRSGRWYRYVGQTWLEEDPPFTASSKPESY